ncbi:zymogen granule membrane protein 16-like [Vanacampus margaritifer]
MHKIVIATIGIFSVFHFAKAEQYAFSQPVGPGGGQSFSLSGDGSITAVRLWEFFNNRVAGIQFRYGYTWSPVIGLAVGAPKEIELFKDEVIIQISGKYTGHIQSLVFITNKCRRLQAGQPGGHSFNMYAPSMETELLLVSGQIKGGSIITFFGAHWGTSQYSLKF